MISLFGIYISIIYSVNLEKAHRGVAMKKLIAGIEIILSVSTLATSNEVKSDFNLLEIKHGEAAS